MGRPRQRPAAIPVLRLHRAAVARFVAGQTHARSSRVGLSRASFDLQQRVFASSLLFIFQFYRIGFWGIFGAHE